MIWTETGTLGRFEVAPYASPNQSEIFKESYWQEMTFDRCRGLLWEFVKEPTIDIPQLQDEKNKKKRGFEGTW